MERFGDENADRIINHDVWMGATREMLFESIGYPDDILEKEMKTRSREICKYCETGKNRYALKVTLDNGAVVGWEGDPGAPRAAILTRERNELEETRLRAAVAADRIARDRDREARYAADAAAEKVARRWLIRKRIAQGVLAVVAFGLFWWKCSSSSPPATGPLAVPAPVPPAPPAETAGAIPASKPSTKARQLPRAPSRDGRIEAGSAPTSSAIARHNPYDPDPPARPAPSSSSAPPAAPLEIKTE